MDSCFHEDKYRHLWLAGSWAVLLRVGFEVPIWLLQKWKPWVIFVYQFCCGLYNVLDVGFKIANVIGAFKTNQSHRELLQGQSYTCEVYSFEPSGQRLGGRAFYSCRLYLLSTCPPCNAEVIRLLSSQGWILRRQPWIAIRRLERLLSSWNALVRWYSVINPGSSKCFEVKSAT